MIAIALAVALGIVLAPFLAAAIHVVLGAAAIGVGAYVGIKIFGRLASLLIALPKMFFKWFFKLPVRIFHWICGIPSRVIAALKRDYKAIAVIAVSFIVLNYIIIFISEKYM